MQLQPRAVRRRTCSSSHHMLTPPPATLSERMKFSVWGLMRSVQILASLATMALTPAGEQSQESAGGTRRVGA